MQFDLKHKEDKKRFSINTGFEIKNHLLTNTSKKGSLLEFSNSNIN